MGWMEVFHLHTSQDEFLPIFEGVRVAETASRDLQNSKIFYILQDIHVGRLHLQTDIDLLSGRR